MLEEEVFEELVEDDDEEDPDTVAEAVEEKFSLEENELSSEASFPSQTKK